MNKEETQYYSVGDIINLTCSKDIEEEGKSDNILNDETYLNIFNIFSTWCINQINDGFTLSVFPLGMLKGGDSGIQIRLADAVIKEFEFKQSEDSGLKNDDNSKDQNKVQKLNLLWLSSQLNLPKILIQSALKDLFRSIFYLLCSETNSVVDLGQLGSFHMKKGSVSHFPSKLKKDNFDKKRTVKSLIGNYTINAKEEVKQTDTLIPSKDSTLILHHSIEEKKSMSKKGTKYYNKTDTIDSFQIGHFINRLSGFFSFKKEKVEKLKFEDSPSPINKVKNYSNKVKLLPISNSRWGLNEMLNSTFKKGVENKSSPTKMNAPVLFNQYSNTKASPFTSEKTQIPITHRVGSFYSLPLQNFIIDRSKKKVKRLYDEYFYKYKNSEVVDFISQSEEYLHLIGVSTNEERIQIRKKNFKIYKKLGTSYYIPDSLISNVKERLLIGIVKMSLRSYSLDNPHFSKVLNLLLKEIVENYKESMRESILDYLLLHPEFREKTGINTTFKERTNKELGRQSEQDSFWKTNFNNSKLRLSNNLMILGKNITDITGYFFKKTKTMTLLDLANTDFTAEGRLNSFIEKQKNKIEDGRNFLTEEWKNHIEFLLKDTKLYKDQLAFYFKAVTAVMSTQTRRLVLNSIQNYHKFIIEFRKSSYPEISQIYKSQFDPSLPFQKSFIELEIICSEQGEFTFAEDLSEVQTRLVSLCYELFKCSQNIEKPDYMYGKNQDLKTYLWEVSINDWELSKTQDQIEETIKENLDIVKTVANIYSPFLFILTEKSTLETFKLNSPKREEIKKSIKFYEDNLKILHEEMPDAIYLNMFKIDCSGINKYLRDTLYELILNLLEHVKLKNINSKSKELCENIEKLKSELSSYAQDEESLNLLETNLEQYKNENIPGLNAEYFDFLEWLFFYLDYDLYPVFPDIKSENLSSGIDLIAYIKNAFASVKTISGALDEFESNLKAKRLTLETSLNKTRAKVNNTITDFKKSVDSAKDAASNAFLSDDYLNSYLELLRGLKKEAVKVDSELQVLLKKEELLGAYPTEDDRIEICNEDLDPMINYVTFYAEYKGIQSEYDFLEIRNLNFEYFTAFIEKSSDIFDVALTKIPTLKSKIPSVKVSFEYFRQGVELSKYIAVITEILRYEKIAEENVWLYEDCSYFCKELLKIILPEKDVKWQEYLKNIKFKDIVLNRLLLDRLKLGLKVEIEKLSIEMECIKQMYDRLFKIADFLDIEFKTENFKEKKFLILSRVSLAEIKNNIKVSISEINDNISSVQNLNNKLNILIKVDEFKSKISTLLEILDKFEKVQVNLEGHMLNSNILQKTKPELFIKLKQAEKEFKVLIDFILEKPKIMNLLSIKEVFIETINIVEKILDEISYQMNNY